MQTKPKAIITTYTPCLHDPRFSYFMALRHGYSESSSQNVPFRSNCRLMNKVPGPGDSVLGESKYQRIPRSELQSPLNNNNKMHGCIALGTVGRISHMNRHCEVGQDSLSPTDKQICFILEEKLKHLEASFRCN